MTKIRIRQIQKSKERRSAIRLFISAFIIAESMLIYSLMTATTLG